MICSRIFYGVAFTLLWLAAALPQAQGAHPYSPQFKATSQVLDYANAFKPRTLHDLKAYAEDSEYYTGTQLVIGIVPSFDGRAATEYALQAAQTLKVNAQGKPGVLLIVSQKDRDARIVAGPQLSEVLPAHVQQAILDRVILPNLRQGKIEKGVIDGVGAIMMSLQGKMVPQPVSATAAKSSGAGGWSPVAIIAALFLLRMVLGGGRRYNRYGGGYGGYGYGGGGSFTGSLIGGVIGALLMGGARRRW